MRLIDLSTELRDGMPKPPSGPRVEMRYLLEPSREEEAGRGFTNKMEQFTISTHVATHIDAPSHFSYEGKNIDEYPLEFFYMVPTQMLHLEREVYGEITAEDIRLAEQRDGVVQKGDLVLLNTGAYRRYEAPEYAQSPFLTEDAARYLAEKQVCMVATDSFTVDDPRRKEKPAHVELLCRHGIPVIECVIRLDQLPVNRFRSICLPLRVKDGSGGYTRMAAVIEEEGETE